MMEKWNLLYERNRKLDSIFESKYLGTVDKYYEKNALELIIEFGEFINETKCFKYWSIKKPNISDMLEEYADCFLMVLYLYNHFDINEVKLVEIDKEKDILLEINNIFNLMTGLIKNGSKELSEVIFSHMYYLKDLLEIREEDIIEACYKKILINEERLASDY